jgi:hypothetical protein
MAADATNPRIALISVDDAGAMVCTVAANDTTVTTDRITDKRVFVDDPVLGLGVERCFTSRCGRVPARPDTRG